MLKNGHEIITKTTGWNQIAVYQCNDDYSLYPTTDYKRHCDSNGKWKGKVGKCIPGKIIYTYFYSNLNIFLFFK